MAPATGKVYVHRAHNFEHETKMAPGMVYRHDLQRMRRVWRKVGLPVRAE